MDLAEALAPHLPHIRRYARALTGEQAAGDACVRATLEALVEGRLRLDEAVSPRVALYKAFEQVWREVGGRATRRGAGPAANAGERVLRISPRSRQAFLLTAVEGFGIEDAGAILGVDASEVESLIARAQADIDSELATRVLIIEDEPVIAADIAGLVRELGHGVTFVAATRGEAAEAARREAPGLVLADIQLADGSSGIDAVRDILSETDTPVIFITAFPERLLTGERPEPTFLITKPFQPETVKAAIGQALFFHPRNRVAA